LKFSGPQPTSSQSQAGTTEQPIDLSVMPSWLYDGMLKKLPPRLKTRTFGVKVPAVDR